jgi:ACS family hexuronate transporter-like MFS transporter
MKIPRLRWWIAGLLFAATIINYIDRQTLSIVAPVVTKELHITPVEYANILQAFLIAYTLMYLASGFLVDRWGTRVSLAVFMVWWSISNALHAITRSTIGLATFRFLLGVGEPGNFMASFKAISEWYPAREKAFVNGLVNAGAAVGAIIAAPLVAWLTVSYGWRASFVATGCFGLLWLLPWLWLYALPEKHTLITADELTLIAAARRAEARAEGRTMSKAELLRHPQTWGLLLARFISDPVWWFYLFWLPKYLVEQRGFTLIEMGMLAWLPYLCADIGSICGGLVSGYLVNKNSNPLRARSLAMLPCALMMMLSVATGLTSSSLLAVAIICVVTFSHMAWKTNLMTMTNDIYPTRLVGSVSGIIAFGSGLGGTLFTSLTGFVVQHSSYTLIFVIMGFLHPAAYLIVRWLVKTPIVSSENASFPHTQEVTS